MTFEPMHGSHAVQEAVLGFSFVGDHRESDLQSLYNDETLLRSLPKRERPTSIQIAFGPANVPPPPMPQTYQPVQFVEFERDGSIKWRLLADQKNLIVNCTAYEGWERFLSRAVDYLSTAERHFTRSQNAVASIMLQYINTFIWDGRPDDYNISNLLKPGAYIPDSIWRIGDNPFWHLHQGWFRPIVAMVAGRLLERIHFDAVNEAGNLIVRVDTTLRFDLSSPLASSGILFGGDQLLPRTENMLHELHKEMMLSYLNSDIAHRIGIHSNQ